MVERSRLAHIGAPAALSGKSFLFIGDEHLIAANAVRAAGGRALLISDHAGDLPDHTPLLEVPGLDRRTASIGRALADPHMRPWLDQIDPAGFPDPKRGMVVVLPSGLPHPGSIGGRRTVGGTHVGDDIENHAESARFLRQRGMNTDEVVDISAIKWKKKYAKNGVVLRGDDGAHASAGEYVYMCRDKRGFDDAVYRLSRSGIRLFVVSPFLRGPSLGMKYVIAEDGIAVAHNAHEILNARPKDNPKPGHKGTANTVVLPPAMIDELRAKTLEIATYRRQQGAHGPEAVDFVGTTPLDLGPRPTAGWTAFASHVDELALFSLYDALLSGDEHGRPLLGVLPIDTRSMQSLLDAADAAPPFISESWRIRRSDTKPELRERGTSRLLRTTNGSWRELGEHETATHDALVATLTRDDEFVPGWSVDFENAEVLRGYFVNELYAEVGTHWCTVGWTSSHDALVGPSRALGPEHTPS